jgi:RHS repeat-associated protein
MSDLGAIVKTTAEDMAEGGERAGKAIVEHFKGIGTELKNSVTRYRGAESDAEHSLTSITEGGAQDAERTTETLGKDSAQAVTSTATTTSEQVTSETASEVESLAAHGPEQELEDAHTPGSQGASRDPVDLVNGEMFLTQRDVALDGILVLVLERMHRSSYARGRLFGRTWASTLDQRLEVDDDGVHYAAPDGTVLHYPVPTQPGQAVLPAAGARWPLSHDQQTDTYRVEKTETGQTLHFAATHAQSTVSFRPLSAVTDRNGNRITVAYDSDAVPTDMYHSGGYHIEVHSSLIRGGPRVGEVLLADPQGGRSTMLVRFGYDTAGRLAEVFNSSGEPLCFEYDEADRITAWIDRNGYRYEYHYDSVSGRVVRAVGADGLLSASLAYDPASRETILTDSAGQRTKYRYNERGQVVEVVDALGGRVLTEQDAHNRLLSRTDELGRTTRISWNNAGKPIRVEYPDGTATRAEYDSRGFPRRVATPTGEVWLYEYDERGNVLAATDPAGATTRYAYDEFGALASVTDPGGGTEQYVNDSRGLPVAMTNPLGATTRIDRDSFGRTVAVTDPLGRTYTAEWTIEGSAARRGLPDGSYEAFVYDPEGNLLEYRDAAGFVTGFEYGGFDRITARITPDRGRYEFEYDTELRLTRVLGPTGLDWRYTYDARGGLIGERDYNGREIAYSLDAAGQLIERSCHGGQSVLFQHDLRGRVVGRRVGEAEYTYEFDPAGLLRRAEGPDGALEFVRDPRGRVLTEAFDGRVVRSEYDAAGRRVRRTTVSGARSEWGFDAAGRATRLAAATGGLDFRRDAAGQETSRALGANAALSQSFDLIGRLTAQAVWVRDAQAADDSGYRSVQGRSYVYRADGFPLEMSDLLGGGARFELDELGRVTAMQAAAWREEYAYDPMGNLAAAGSVDSDAASREPFEIRGTLTRRAARTSYEHDDRGRVVRRSRRTLSGQRREWTYRWDAEDRLREVRTPEGSTWRYVYEPLGRRVAKRCVRPDGIVEAEVDYAWDGQRLAEEARRRPDGTVTILTWDYEPGTFRPAAQRRRTWVDGAPQEQIDEEFYAIIADRAGTPRELVTPDGRVGWRQSEGLWGQATRETASEVDCPLRFPGQYFDEETGWHYNLHRYYDPEIASYVSPDPLGLAPGFNHHAYVGNPLTDSDPLGLAPASCPSWGDQEPVALAARQEADKLAPVRPDEVRPRVSEALQTQSGTIYTAASTRGAAPVLHSDVQNVLDGVPEAERGVGHGKCGLPVAISEAVRAGDDPHGASAAAVLVRGDVNKAKHGFGIGPCPSCQALRDHYDIHFVTGD